ncbi:MAG: hypothetical protein HYX92_10095 [Chloroflexi bacterium]|nr:hypothetical protein [Chloroflexota bacterium]
MRKVVLAGIVGLAALGIWLVGAQVYAVDESNCLQCHGKPGLKKKTPDGEIDLYVKVESLNTAAHRFIDCTTCHTTNPHKVETPLTKLSLAQKCGSCHQYEYKQHLQSIHGEQLAQGNTEVATCVDCHSPERDPHGVMRVLEYKAPAYKKNIAGTCARCHGDEQLMKSYGILEKVYESYMRSFHGKALQLGTYELAQLDAATCTNCHGVHDIKRASDPASLVAGMDNLAKTCDQCHVGGGSGLASGFLGHREASPDRIPVAHYTEVFLTILTTSVVGLGVLVMGTATIRYAANRWRE